MSGSRGAPEDEVRKIRRLRRFAYALHLLGNTRRAPAGRERAVHSVLHVAPVLFGTDGVIGGGERSSYGFACAVAKKLPTTLVTTGPRRDRLSDGELRIEIYPSAGELGGQLFDPLCYRFLEQLRGVDVVHCHQYQVAVSQLAILAGSALGKRTFVTDRGGVGVHFDPHVPVERHLTALLPMSKFSESLLPQGVPSQVIHGGTTERFLADGSPPSATPPEQSRRALYVGRIMRHKGIDVLVRALPAGVGLDVIGHVYDEEYLALLQQLAEGRDVRFVHDATDEQLVSAYREALVTVLPSVYVDAFGGRWEMPELLGNVLLESMACGTPVICSDVGGMPEIVEGSLGGFVVPPSDPAALGSRIAQLAGDERLRSEMGRRAHQRVLERFTWKLAADEAIASYQAAWPAG
jgi:glycosyltransferase involved in cell wall biosynthesis